MNKEDLKKEFRELEFEHWSSKFSEFICIPDSSKDALADWWLEKIDRAKEEGFNWSQNVKQVDFEQWKMNFRSELIEKIGQEMQTIIEKSKATFFIGKDVKAEISVDEALSELTAEISNNVGLYIYNLIKEGK